MFNNDISIDLGTATVQVYIKNKGIVLNEPSIVAMERDTKKIIAVGTKANEMLGRTPGKIITIKPLKDGVIADLEATEIMLNEFIKKLKIKKQIVKPKILICCPCNINQIEKDALREVAESAGANEVYIEEEPKIAAIGAGLNIKEPKANMIVDIGGGTTDIAILSLNGIVISNSIKIAGNTFNNEIIKYIKEKYKLLIGEVTAENIKISFTNIYNPSTSNKYNVKGRDLVTGLPKIITITQEETQDALKESINKIIKKITNILENSPPELSADIIENGIVLTGGGALLKGMVEILETNLKVPIFISETPLTCVAEGAGKLLEELKNTMKGP